MLKTLYFEEFPLPSYNGAFSITHIDAWTFYPQADHQKPLCQGFNTQANNISNLVTCSSVLNIFIKNKLSIDDIDAMLIPIESLDNKWDGLKSKTQEFKKNRTEYFDKKCLEASKYYNERLIYAKAQKEEILK